MTIPLPHLRLTPPSCPRTPPLPTLLVGRSIGSVGFLSEASLAGGPAMWRAEEQTQTDPHLLQPFAKRSRPCHRQQLPWSGLQVLSTNQKGPSASPGTALCPRLQPCPPGTQHLEALEGSQHGAPRVRCDHLDLRTVHAPQHGHRLGRRAPASRQVRGRAAWHPRQTDTKYETCFYFRSKYRADPCKTTYKVGLRCLSPKLPLSTSEKNQASR